MIYVGGTADQAALAPLPIKPIDHSSARFGGGRMATFLGPAK